MQPTSVNKLQILSCFERLNIFQPDNVYIWNDTACQGGGRWGIKKCYLTHQMFLLIYRNRFQWFCFPVNWHNLQWSLGNFFGKQVRFSRTTLESKYLSKLGQRSLLVSLWLNICCLQKVECKRIWNARNYESQIKGRIQSKKSSKKNSFQKKTRTTKVE